LKTPALSAIADTILLFSMTVISLQHNVVTIVLVVRTSASGDMLPSRELVEQNIEYEVAGSRPLSVKDPVLIKVLELTGFRVARSPLR
jgi:hypothetical protein